MGGASRIPLPRSGYTLVKWFRYHDKPFGISCFTQIL